MQLIETNTIIAAPIVAGVTSGVIGQVFGISELEMMFAFAGAFIGLMFQEPAPYIETKYGPIVRFCKTVGILILVTLTTAALLPIIFGATTSFAKTSMAFIAGAFAMLFKGEVNGMRKVFVRGLKGLVERWLGGFSK